MNSPLLPRIVEALRDYDCATISNAIENFQVRDRTVGYTSMEIRCQFPEFKAHGRLRHHLHYGQHHART